MGFYINPDKTACILIPVCKSTHLKLPDDTVEAENALRKKNLEENFQMQSCQCGEGSVCNSSTGHYCVPIRGLCTKEQVSCKRSAPIITSRGSDGIKVIDNSKCELFSARCECSKCINRHHTSKCIACPTENVAKILLACNFVLAVFVLYLFICFLYYMFRPSTSGATAEVTKLKGKVKQVAKLSASVGGALLSVVINQMQMITVIWSTIDWSPDLPPW